MLLAAPGNAGRFYKPWCRDRFEDVARLENETRLFLSHQNLLTNQPSHHSQGQVLPMRGVRDIPGLDRVREVSAFDQNRRPLLGP